MSRDDFVEGSHRAALDLLRLADGSTVRPGDRRDDVPRDDIRFDALHANTISPSLHAKGRLLIRGLLDQTDAAELALGIDDAFDAFDAWARAPQQLEFGSSFVPFMPEVLDVQMTRPALRANGGILTADAPATFERWVALIRSSGLYDIVTDFFGEPPITSLTKGTLRRVRAGDGIEWHQDGAFLGVDSGALNVWVSLSDTALSPGLEIVGRRFDEIVPTGTHGAGYDWSVGDGLVQALGVESPIVRPHFGVGDALIFDGLLLHRTAQDAPALPGTRYAIETWFFRPSRFPDHQRVPLAL